ncbi:DUF726-domain-containing protein [Lepidopterella palustris CBS 459.81]|uniref:DUF726-domain-containing protein n=1 Tax=Lepidopterella palustris CBS 459.81 TaxID=1314670 RepID=A0A8E2DZ60_9PEZI|nr:DUF726-domain-containing protein [Lepidopterella palustris CBS 459.81]
MRRSHTETFSVDSVSPSYADTLETAPKVLSSIDVEKENMERREKQKRREVAEKEIVKPEAQELLGDSVKWFDGWRDTVLQRVDEFVNSKSKAQTQERRARGRDEEPEVRTGRLSASTSNPETRKYEGADEILQELYPPIVTPLRKLDEPKRALNTTPRSRAVAQSRILLLHLTSSLGLSVAVLAEVESKVARSLLDAVRWQMNADAETKQKAESKASSRKWKVGLAGVAGAAIIGITGGLAAPLLTAGIDSVMGGLGLGATTAAGYLETLASSTVLVGGLFGAYGGRMTGQMMDQYAKEVSDFGFVPIRNFTGEVVTPWRVIGPSIEGFALRWELEALLKLGNSISIMVQSVAWSYAKSEIVKRTVLADAVVNKVQGERPVILIGYSLGARAIYTCLMKVAERRAFGLVESVVLVGAPTPADAMEWRKIRNVVAGRVVNVFSTNDYILALLYRTSSIQYGVAGLQKVEKVKGVQNVDVSELVSGHTSYRYLTGSILKKIGFEDIDLEEVEREERS